MKAINSILTGMGIKRSVAVVDAYADIHSHILPGVDDGAKCLDVSMEMLEAAWQQGVRILILTPHYEIGRGSRTAEELKAIFAELQRQAIARFDGLQLYLGNEILYSEGIVDRLQVGKALTLAESRYVLLEYPINTSFSKIVDSVIVLQRQRYLPIIAHVERYESVIRSKKHLMELKQMGALLQMNGSSVKKHMKYVREGLIDLIASDCHDLTKRPPNMKDAAVLIQRNCNEEICRNVLWENGDMITRKKYSRER